MGIWIFMMIVCMMIPFMMLGFGGVWRKNPPKGVNDMFGYRTPRSKKNEDTWEFAHKYAGTVWYKWGWAFIVITLIVGAFVYGESNEFIAACLGYYCIFECIPLIAVIIPTERALKQTFDEHGQRICPEEVAKFNKPEDVENIKCPEGFSIREMTLEDWNDVRRIYAQGIEEGTSTFSTNIPDYSTWDEAHLTDCRYVITNGYNIAGWCAISAMSSKRAYWGTVEVSIYMDDNHRGMGLGKALLAHLITESEKLGYWSLYSCIFANNETSISLHKKLGFRMIGRREAVAKDRFGVWQDTVLMERRNSVK